MVSILQIFKKQPILTLQPINSTNNIRFEGVLTIFIPSKPIYKIIHKTYQNTHSDILKPMVHLS